MADQIKPMDQLHSYWRMEYIEAPTQLKAGSKLFSELPKSTDDKSTLILKRSEFTYIVLNKFPYNAGHLLVVPYREVSQLKALSKEERLDLMDNIVASQEILNKAITPHGFNIGFNFGSAAGAGIPNHLHCHIVPRWSGDTNFMPVLGSTKVLPQSLEAMWERLKAFT